MALGQMVQHIGPGAESRAIRWTVAWLRGALIGSFWLLAACGAGVAVGLSTGRFLWGFVTGLIFVLVGIFAAAVFARRRIDKPLTRLDCGLPIAASILSGILFFPIQFAEGSYFSTGTCIGAGILLSAALNLYRQGKTRRGFVLLPLAVFFYEILPIELPTDLDNIFSLGGSLATVFWAYLNASKENSSRDSKPECDQSTPPGAL